jgi:HSP20 family protein
MSSIIPQNAFVESVSNGIEAPGIKGPLTNTNFLLPVDIFEDDRNIMLRAEIPGVKPEELNITLYNNVLTITGNRKFKEEEKKEDHHWIEQLYGQFTRSFTLSSRLDAEKAKASFENGVLSIELPRKQGANLQQIAIAVKMPTVVAAKSKGNSLQNGHARPAAVLV